MGNSDEFLFFSHGEHMEWLKGLLLQTAVVNVPLISF